jgi:hypothetical protein
MATTTIEVWVMVDSAGDYAVGKDTEGAKEQYGNDIQAPEDAEGFRLVKLLLTVPLPEVVEASGTMPDEGGEVKLAGA